MLLPHSLRTVQKKPLLVFGAGSYNTSSATSHTYTSISIGSENAYRRVVVGLAYRLNATTDPALPTVTVGGVSTTAITSSVSDTSTNSVVRVGCALYVTDDFVPSGATANVVVSGGTRTLTRSFISTYALIKDKYSLLTSGSSANGSASASASWSYFVFIGSPDPAISIGAAGTLNTLTGFSVSGPATTDYDSGIQSNGALISTTNTGSGTTTFTSTGLSSTARISYAVWR